ncbi:MAG: hypothetical protein V4819_06130 [Verrucomicrobiota bacterium]
MKGDFDLIPEMSTPSNRRNTAFYWWLGGFCTVGFVASTYFLLDAEITMRWAHHQYEIREETAAKIAGLIWLPVLAIVSGFRALFIFARRA